MLNILSNSRAITTTLACALLGCTAVTANAEPTRYSHEFVGSYYQASLSNAGYVLGETENGGQKFWLFDGSTTVRVSPDDADHTASSGYQWAEVHRWNRDRQVAGEARVFKGTSSEVGQSAWFYDGAATHRIGLLDATHTAANGHQESWVRGMNQAGQVIGDSVQFRGQAYDYYGSYADSGWLHQDGQTVRLGLTGSAYTDADGLPRSFTRRINEAGQVLGGSFATSGWEIWIYDSGNYTTIGLTGAEHTRPDGGRTNSPNSLNNAGQVTGSAYRYDGADHKGTSAWFYDGTQTVEIGLLDTEHTSGAGARRSVDQWLNDAGQVAGYSWRYNGQSSQHGQTAWLYNGTQTINLSLGGAEHTRDDGYEWSEVEVLKDTGYVLGHSKRYSGSADNGQSVWLYNGSETVHIGLVDAEHTRGDGYKFSESRYTHRVATSSGFVIGESKRFDGNTDMGQSAWLFNGEETINVGLTDPTHTRDDGYRYSDVRHVNEAGQVAGISHHYTDSHPIGGTAWVYDSLLGTQTFVLSTRSDGVSNSSISYLSEEGWVLGTYYVYDGMTTVGERAFYWSREHGTWDLADLIENAQEDWEFSGFQTNELGQILVAVDDFGETWVLLTPIPEPAGLAILTLASLPLLRRRRA